MPVKRTTIELDENLVKAAQRVTGQTLRATVEEGLRALLANAKSDRQDKSVRISAHLASARDAIDPEVLRSDEAWR